MDQSLRQRGWSIHSADDHGLRSQEQRPRADSQMTCDTEPSMSEADKLHLLNSAFEGDADGVGGGDDDDIAVPPRNAIGRSMSDSVDEGGEENYLNMCEGEEGESEEGDDAAKGHNKNNISPKMEPPKKRRKTGKDESVAAGNEDGGNISDGGSSGSEDDSETGEKLKTKKKPHILLTQKQQEQLDLAKNKLSKWAARLFDPNRPRGLVEPPKVIPLNDEFLTAFGKREKEYHDLAGRDDIDKTSLDVIDVSDGENEGAGKPKGKDAKKRDFSEMSECKVKIVNLSYKTTTATIARTCGEIGPVVDVNLILDDNGQSSGRAYVVFEEHESAEICVSKMNDKPLEGRTLYISLASASGRKSFNPSKKQDSRYWERDISTKCNSCGAVGHIAKNCPNGEKLKLCQLCAEVGHEMWHCPQKSVCFNCGVPGHVSRECTQRRGLPERYVCTICYRSGHRKHQCRERPWDAPSQDAVCMQCGKLGHLMCSEMRWFFGLKGVSCFNCGEKGHRGIFCRRPNLDACNKYPEVAQREIVMAGTVSLSDQLSNQRSHRESRDSRMRQNPNDNSRARSNPPPRNRGNNDDYSRRGSNNSRDSRWQEPPPQRSHHRY